MQPENFPGIYKSADALSASSQKKFFGVLALHLSLLVIGAALSAINNPSILTVIAQVVVLLGALFCSIYLLGTRPERKWYSARAVAESVKTVTWRFGCRAEPFASDDNVSEAHLREVLRKIVEQNSDITRALTRYLMDHQVTLEMRAMRSQSLADRKNTYKSDRIENQLAWYAGKAEVNSRAATKSFLFLVIVNALAVLSALLRIKCLDASFWYTDILVAAAASLLSWIQAKRYSELAASYALAAHEIGIIREEALAPNSEDEFSKFVADSENAFSREHTQWLARKDA